MLSNPGSSIIHISNMVNPLEIKMRGQEEVKAVSHPRGDDMRVRNKNDAEREGRVLVRVSREDNVRRRLYKKRKAAQKRKRPKEPPKPSGKIVQARNE